MSEACVKMKCLSVRQPWANAICTAGKTVENRVWYTAYRGPLLIHASQRIAWQAVREGPLAKRLQSVIAAGPMPTGAIIGVVLLLDVVEDSPSEWAEPDSWHWLLAEPRLLAEPIPFSGKLGIFEVAIPQDAALFQKKPCAEQGDEKLYIYLKRRIQCQLARGVATCL